MINIHRTIFLLQMKKWLNSDNLIVDTETTGLEEYDEIIEISIINMKGDVLLDTLVKPTRPIPAEATAINNITDEMVANAPSWGEVYPLVMSVLSNNKWLAWNSKFDARMITQTSLITGIYRDLQPENVLEMYRVIHSGHIDAKATYSQWYGEFSDKNKNFVRQSLSMAVSQQNVTTKTEAHRSLADCQRVLCVIQNACNDKYLPDIESKVILRQPYPVNLDPCPFCSGPPSLFIHHLHDVSWKPLWSPVDYGDDGLYAEAHVFCHECGATSESASDCIFDDGDAEYLLNMAKRNWNTRDKRHQDLYESSKARGKNE